MKEDFTDTFNREILSLLKWIFVIGFAAAAYYVVTPKYVLSNRGDIRMNSITGDVRVSDGADDDGVIRF